VAIRSQSRLHSARLRRRRAVRAGRGAARRLVDRAGFGERRRRDVVQRRACAIDRSTSSAYRSNVCAHRCCCWCCCCFASLTTARYSVADQQLSQRWQMPNKPAVLMIRVNAAPVVLQVHTTSLSLSPPPLNNNNNNNNMNQAPDGGDVPLEQRGMSSIDGAGAIVGDIDAPTLQSSLDMHAPSDPNLILQNKSLRVIPDRVFSFARLQVLFCVFLLLSQHARLYACSSTNTACYQQRCCRCNPTPSSPFRRASARCVSCACFDSGPINSRLCPTVRCVYMRVRNHPLTSRLLCRIGVVAFVGDAGHWQKSISKAAKRHHKDHDARGFASALESIHDAAQRCRPVDQAAHVERVDQSNLARRRSTLVVARARKVCQFVLLLFENRKLMHCCVLCVCIDWNCRTIVSCRCRRLFHTYRRSRCFCSAAIV
jgi:hypothetical protein